MSDDATELFPERSSARPRDLAPVLAIVIAFLIVYGTELFNFSLSIDEEIATFVADRATAWLQQGRWGMSLLTVALPNFEAVPFVSTALFGLGLGLAALRAIRDFRLGGFAAIVFAVVHTAFPLWLHVGEFNTLAGGFGIGIASAAWGAGASTRSRRRLRWDAMVALAFAIAVYQTLAFYALLYIFMTLEAQRPAAGEDLRSLARRGVPPLLVWAGAMAMYWVVQKIGLAVFDTGMTYVGGYMQPGKLLADPARSITQALRYLASLGLGAHPMYLGWGGVILLLPWLGLLPNAWGQPPAQRWHDWRGTLLVGALGLGMVAALAAISGASLPARAYVFWPLLASWLSTRAARGVGPDVPRVHQLGWALLAWFCIVAASIGASSFYADRVVHSADADMARGLVSEMQRVAIEAHLAPPLTFTLSGQRGFPAKGQIERAELFGTSFFEQDGGNVYRVYFLMQLQGADGFSPIPLSDRPGLAQAARDMPDWPAPGSVRAVDGVLVLRIGPPTAPQLAAR